MLIVNRSYVRLTDMQVNPQGTVVTGKCETNTKTSDDYAAVTAAA